MKPVYSGHYRDKFSDLIKEVAALSRSLYTVGACGDSYNGQFIQVTSLCSDLVRQVSLSNSTVVLFSRVLLK